MKTNLIVVVWMSILLLSCKERVQQQPAPQPDMNTADSVELPYPTDSNVPVDTNDHNKGTVSTVTLDAPEEKVKELKSIPPDSAFPSHNK